MLIQRKVFYFKGRKVFGMFKSIKRKFSVSLLVLIVVLFMLACILCMRKE